MHCAALLLIINALLFFFSQCYAPKFREHGYDTAGFLSGMTDKVSQLIRKIIAGQLNNYLWFIAIH